MGKYSWEEICQEAEKLGCGPLSLDFYKCLGKLPTHEELRKYIDLVFLPVDNHFVYDLKREQFLRLIRYG